MTGKRALAVALTLVAASASADTLPRFGMMTDVGVPDGATASIVVRPLRQVRLNAGVGHNLVAPGVRGGVTVIPFGTWFAPTLAVDYGHFSEGNANPAIQMITGDPTFDSKQLERIGYDYIDAHAGIELGRKWFTFYLHAGMSRISGTIHNLSSSPSDGSMTTVTFTRDPNVTLTTVSARLGIVFYFAK
jgi:hypothetical protein